MNQALKTSEGMELAEFKYRFKRDDLGNQRQSVALMVPVLTLAQIAEIVGSTTTNEKGEVVPSKEAELIKEAVYTVYQDQIRSIVNDKEDVSQANFPMDQATWSYIANMDRTSRRGAGIAKELWEAFAADYVKVMPAVLGKTAEQCTQAAQILTRKFRDVTGNLPIVEKLVSYLGVYIQANGSKAEEFQDILEFLSKKASDMLAARDKQVTAENL